MTKSYSTTTHMQQQWKRMHAYTYENTKQEHTIKANKRAIKAIYTHIWATPDGADSNSSQD